MHDGYLLYSLDTRFDVAIVAPSNISTLAPLSATHELRSILTAWDENSPHQKCTTNAIECLLRLGCRFFATFGPYAEELHDVVDNLAESWERENREPRIRSATIITTIHDDEPFDETFNFVRIFSDPEQKNSEAILLIAVVNPASDKDIPIIEALHHELGIN